MGVEVVARVVVLVVEDETLVREIIANEFRRYGWHVLEAASGEHAIALMMDNHIDIVFTDVHLAGVMSGWDTAEALRTRVPTVPILYTSGHACDPTRQVVGSLFIAKPYKSAFIIEACHNLLNDPEEFAPTTLA